MDTTVVVTEQASTSSAILDWFSGDGFVLILVVMFAAIMISFMVRLNKLEAAINTLNLRLDNLSKTLVDISHRPCQLESHGFNVEITDPTGKKLETIKKTTSN